jgi:hypothetical protein
MSERFRQYSRYLKEKYGVPAYRVSVDAGFSCPNRGKMREVSGCTYCDEAGSRADYLHGREGSAPLGDRKELRRQIQRGITFMRKRYGAEVFLLYFQAFSNTFAPVERLKHIYDYALGLASFSELIVSTRPDCLDTEKADLLASYKNDDRDVWVELGLQSSRPETLQRINRGHDFTDFEKAYGLLRERNIKKTVHLIFGLPGEGWKEIEETMRTVASLRPEGIKIHNLTLPEGTHLFEEYLKGELVLPSASRHLEYLANALELLPPDTIIMRLTCDPPRGKPSLPVHFRDKQKVYRALEKELRRRGSFQGSSFNPSILPFHDMKTMTGG